MGKKEHHQDKDLLTIIGIGASAGGLTVLKHFCADA